jgi:hypothetical protein
MVSGGSPLASLLWIGFRRVLTDRKIDHFREDFTQTCIDSPLSSALGSLRKNIEVTHVYFEKVEKLTLQFYDIHIASCPHFLNKIQFQLCNGVPNLLFYFLFYQVPLRAHRDDSHPPSPPRVVFTTHPQRNLFSVVKF